MVGTAKWQWRTQHQTRPKETRAEEEEADGEPKRRVRFCSQEDLLVNVPKVPLKTQKCLRGTLRNSWISRNFSGKDRSHT